MSILLSQYFVDQRGEAWVGAIQKAGLLDKVVVHSSLNGGGAYIYARPSEGCGYRAKYDPAERPNKHHPAWLRRAIWHRFQEPGAMAPLMSEGLLDPGDEVGVAALGSRKLGAVDCNGAVLACVINTENAANDAGRVHGDNLA